MADSSDHVVIPEPDDLASADGSDVASATSTAGRSRLSRPVPSHLFARRKAETQENGGRIRPTRVIPALAKQPAAGESEPAPDAAPADETPSDAARVDYPPDLVFIVRADGTVLYVNRPLGPRGEEDVIGSDFYDWVFPEQHGLVREALGRVFATARADGIELSGIQTYEPDAWYECRIAPNHREGKVVSATIIARDVTRYKRAEQALRTEHEELRRLVEERTADLEGAKAQLAQRPAERDEAQAAASRFRTLLDAAGEAIFVTDPQTETLVEANETACRWLRRRRDELVGQTVTSLDLGFPVLPPPSLDVQFTETRDTRRPLVLDGAHRRRDGSAFPVEVAVAAHSVGDREFVLAVVRDAKGRRRTDEALAESDARYRALLDQSFDAIFLTTRAGQVLDANEAALALFGYERRGFVGLDARTVMPKVDDVRRFQRAMAQDGIVRRLDVELRHRDGTMFPAQVSATRRPDAQDRLLGYQWVVRDAGPPPVREAPVGEAAAAPAPVGVAEAEYPVVLTVAATAPSGDFMLVVDGDARHLAESKSALGAIGKPILTASTAGEAILVVRARTPHVTLAVVGPVPDAAPEDVARDLQAVYPSLRIVLTTPDDPFATLERASDLAIEACLRHPVHPLALVQSVRDALGELPGA